MCDLLGKNLLLLIWFTKDFEGESSASSLGTFCLWDLLRKNICFHTRDILGKNLLLSHWGFAFVYLGPSGRNLLPIP